MHPKDAQFKWTWPADVPISSRSSAAVTVAVDSARTKSDAPSLLEFETDRNKQRLTLHVSVDFGGGWAGGPQS